MKLIIFSDIHEDGFTAEEFIKKEIKAAKAKNEEYLVINAGDSQLPDEWVEKHFDYYVKGLEDKDSKFEKTIQFTIGEKTEKSLNFVLTHGSDLAEEPIFLIMESKMPEIFQKFAEKNNITTKRNCFIFGFSHYPMDVNLKNETYIINPGSATLPKNGSVATYAVVDFDEKEQVIKNVKFNSTSILNDYDEMHIVHI